MSYLIQVVISFDNHSVVYLFFNFLEMSNPKTYIELKNYLKRKTHEFVSQNKLYNPKLYDENLFSILSDQEKDGLKEKRFVYKKSRAKEFREDNKELLRILCEHRLKINNKESDRNLLNNKMMWILAHDLRSPLATLIGIVNYLDSQENISTDEELWLFLKENIHSLSKRFEEYLLWQNLGEINKVDVIVDEILEDVISFSSMESKSKWINIIADFKNLKLKTDPHLLKIILENLLSNAIKHSPRKSKVVISCDFVNDFVEFSVQDSGDGIKNPEKLFQNPVKVDEGRVSGLGLKFADDFVKRLGGEIWIESKEWEWAVFKFRIPAN
jgi:signal transduction histidine kinase